MRLDRFRYRAGLCFFALAIAVSGCGKQQDTRKPVQNSSGQFSWKDGLSLDDIPDAPVKCFLRGKDVNFSYINFERWRGSNDNVIRFSLEKPSQPCGFIEKFQGIELTRKGKYFELGNYTKDHFTDNLQGFQISYVFDFGDGNISRSDCNWDFGLKIDSINEKTVSGKIGICFNDETKSWIAGKFEAKICNN